MTSGKMDFTKGQELQRRLHQLVPGGGHTYSKGTDQFPQNAPGLMVRGKGSRAWDADGNEFVDWGMGLRSVTLGYAYEPVDNAVIDQIHMGTNFTRPSVTELKLAEKMTGLLGVDMVKFGKNGSDVTSAAIRLSRAFTGRRYVAICAEHPFFSFDDWFIGTTPCNNGVPEEVRQLTLKFHYNDIDSVKALIREYPDQIAAVILEPLKIDEVKDDFLGKLRALTAENGIVLIFDEMISGFRFALKGAQSIVKVKPDLTTFGKGCANGYSVSMLAGKKEIMELGGFFHDRPRVFLLSQTHGAENTGLAAALATIHEFETGPVIDHMWRIGEQLTTGVNEAAAAAGMAAHVKLAGFACSPVLLVLDADGRFSYPLLTVFQEEVIANGVLMPWISVSYSHSEADVEKTVEAVAAGIARVKEVLESGKDPREFFEGPPIKPVWRTYNRDYD